jgi:hypothetical protein
VDDKKDLYNKGPSVEYYNIQKIYQYENKQLFVINVTTLLNSPIVKLQYSIPFVDLAIELDRFFANSVHEFLLD